MQLPCHFLRLWQVFENAKERMTHWLEIARPERGRFGIGGFEIDRAAGEALAGVILEGQVQQLSCNPVSPVSCSDVSSGNFNDGGSVQNVNAISLVGGKADEPGGRAAIHG